MRRLFWLVALALVAMPLCAQDVTMPGSVSDIIDQFRHAAGVNWLQTAEDAGTNLFGWLAKIEVACAFIGLMMTMSDVPTWGAQIVRTTLLIGLMFGLLTLGPGLASDLIEGYTVIGQRATGIQGGISASDIISDGANISCTLLITASQKAGTMNLLTALVLFGAGVVVLWSFLKLVKAFVIARIETYITITAAAFQLAFGASRFTNTYAERYIGSAVANGVRILCVYLVVGIERALMPSWIQQVADLDMSGFTSGLTRLVLLTISIFLFCSIIEIERWAAAIFGGQPQFTGHDVTNTYAPVVSMGAGAIAATLSTYATLQSAGVLGAVGAAAGAAGGAGGFGGGFAGAGASFAGAIPSLGAGSSSASNRSAYRTPPSLGPSQSPKLLPPPATV